jgi:hypothetical protein
MLWALGNPRSKDGSRECPASRCRQGVPSVPPYRVVGQRDSAGRRAKSPANVRLHLPRPKAGHLWDNRTASPGVSRSEIGRSASALPFKLMVLYDCGAPAVNAFPTTPALVELELVPVRHRPGWYAATLPDGTPVGRVSRQPFLDAARALLRAGLAPASEMQARHRGSAVIAMRYTVAAAAKWTVKERDRGGLRREMWQPCEMGHSSIPVVSENACDPGPTEKATGLAPHAPVEHESIRVRPSLAPGDSWQRNASVG